MLEIAALGQYFEPVSFASTPTTAVFPSNIVVRSPSLSGSSTAMLLARRGTAEFMHLHDAGSAVDGVLAETPGEEL